MKLRCHGENFLVVNADDFDNFLVYNHKVVLLTTHLKTFQQPFVLCEWNSGIFCEADDRSYCIIYILVRCVESYFYGQAKLGVLVCSDMD